VEIDPFDDPLWEEVEKGTRSRQAGFVGCPMSWLKLVLPHTKTAKQLAVASFLYRLRILRRSKTVSLPNGVLESLGISRYAKYRALAELERAVVIAIRHENGRAIRVTLLK
jgi:hypothetical protein